MIRVPCYRHLWHDVEDLEAAIIVSALAALAADGWVETESVHAGDPADEHLVCPLDALGWARDVEMYAEHVEQSLICAEILREDEHEGRVVTEWRERSERRDGREVQR
jgi:hypothetical protein